MLTHASGPCKNIGHNAVMKFYWSKFKKTLRSCPTTILEWLNFFYINFIIFALCSYSDFSISERNWYKKMIYYHGMKFSRCMKLIQQKYFLTLICGRISLINGIIVPGPRAQFSPTHAAPSFSSRWSASTMGTPSKVMHGPSVMSNGHIVTIAGSSVMSISETWQVGNLETIISY